MTSKILLLIDYQKAFKKEETVDNISKLATHHKWDNIIQTLWFNSKTESSLYMQNLGYGECDPNSKDSGLVKRFKNSVMVPRYDMYSCVDENLVHMIYGGAEVYIAGWETDACVLGTCFGLFDRGINFKVITDCVSSANTDVHVAALKIIQRNFGRSCLVESKDLAF